MSAHVQAASLEAAQRVLTANEAARLERVARLLRSQLLERAARSPERGFAGRAQVAKNWSALFSVVAVLTTVGPTILGMLRAALGPRTFQSAS